MLEPALGALHVEGEGLPRGTAPAPAIPEVLRAVAGRRPGLVSAALDTFLIPAMRRSIGELLEPAATWTFRGCDDVSGKSIERLGQRIVRVCSARATGGSVGHLVEVSYTDREEAGFIDWYDF
jgi:hypothetical protein